MKKIILLILFVSAGWWDAHCSPDWDRCLEGNFTSIGELSAPEVQQLKKALGVIMYWHGKESKLDFRELTKVVSAKLRGKSVDDVYVLVALIVRHGNNLNVHKRLEIERDLIEYAIVQFGDGGNWRERLPAIDENNSDLSKSIDAWEVSKETQKAAVQK